jgi:hypothetical protein
MLEKEVKIYYLRYLQRFLIVTIYLQPAFQGEYVAVALFIAINIE